MVNRIAGCLGVVALSSALVALPARAADTEPGVWWEQTVKMEMPGMPMAMPPQTSKVCVAKGGLREPPKADDGCTVSDVKTVGDAMTWKMECTKPEKMSGEGRMTSQKDSYTGVMTMRSKQGEMTMSMSGKKVGGDCDADAPRKQAAAMKKQVDEMQAKSNKDMAEMCGKAVDELQFQLFVPPIGMCKDPAQAAKLCEKLSTRAGFTAYRKQAKGDPGLAKNAQTLCKQDPESHRPQLCADAAAEAKGAKAAPSRQTLGFLAQQCPPEARAFAQSACAGRSYSGDEGADDPLRDICVQYAKDELAKGGSKAPPPDEKPKTGKDQAVDSAKKALKGLFGK